MHRIIVLEAVPRSLQEETNQLSLQGFYVYAAELGLPAKQIKEGRFDLILIDGKSSSLSAYKKVGDLRSAGITIPVVILASKGYEVLKSVVSSSDNGNRYQELLSQIAQLLRYRKAITCGVDSYRFNGVTVDFKRYTVIKDGKPIELTPLELRLLQFMISRRNEVLSRDEILNAVWGEDLYVDTRTIDTHIAHLRGKIEKNPSQPKLILSVRGVGYRFEG
ncbi:MAG TPA: response regulator transcription factor [Bacteroidota bacterium]|nr:response regulator transcription factor [Bacteroidota bacterium]